MRAATGGFIACIVVVAGLTLPGLAEPVPSVSLASGGRALLPIVLVAEALPAERTAAAELADYLKRITGAEFKVASEADHLAGDPGIFIGPTGLADRAGIDAAALGEEEWIIETRDRSLILVGGRPRGTLYAVYRFLEDVMGVRWWTPFEESVPRRPEASLGGLSMRGKPVFGYRDVAGIDGPRAFCARNRMNGHKAGLTWAYGGTVDYGPPKQVHNAFLYVPPGEYFDSNPEFFSEIGGVRFGDRAQLCLTHPDLVQVVGDRMLEYIRAARHAAKIRGVPPPSLFAFSHNDWGKACSCDVCRAAADREGGHPSALLIAFVNRLADIVKEHYPDVMVDTLAYSFTFEPPERIVARDNVVVRLSGLYQRDFSKGVAHPDNRAILEALDGWRRAAPNLRIWDYTVIYGPDGDLPLPNLGYLADDLRAYLDHGVEGLFVQHVHPIAGDLRDMKLWILLKLLEDPNRDFRALLHEFTDGYYGSAGKTIRRYVAHLEQSAAGSPARIEFSSDRDDFTYIDAAFARRAHKLFDKAARQVSGDAVKSRRVRHARLSLDRATLLRGIAGFDRVKIAERYKRTAYEQIELRADRSARESLRDQVDTEIARYLLD